MWLGAEDQESLAALNHAIDLGVNFIDTALAYGRGHSERLVGKVVAERDERIVVASKIPPKNLLGRRRTGSSPTRRFPGEHIRKCTERSLKNLGMDAIDVMQFHVWNDEWIGRGDWLETIQALRDEGKIRFFGVSINDHQPDNAIQLIETGAVDTVQVIYNVFEQAPEDRLLAACEQNDVGVIARVPFDEGGLTGRVTPDTTFPDGDFRNEYFSGDHSVEHVDQHVRAILEDLRDHARRAARGGAALRPQPPRGLDRDPRHADGPQRGPQRRGRRRRGPARGARRRPQGPPLGHDLARRA